MCVQVYKELEQNANQAYWEDVQTIVVDELAKLRRLAAPGARRDGVHQAVAEDVTQVRPRAPPPPTAPLPPPPPSLCYYYSYKYVCALQIFKGKSGGQLAALQTQIERKMSARRDGVDVPYWESLLSQLKGRTILLFLLVIFKYKKK